MTKLAVLEMMIAIACVPGVLNSARARKALNPILNPRPRPSKRDVRFTGSLKSTGSGDLFTLLQVGKHLNSSVNSKDLAVNK